MEEQQVNEALEILIKATRQRVFLPEYRDQTTDADVLGIMLAKYLGWDGSKILEATYSALEDSNYHTLNKEIEKLQAKI